MNMNLRGGAEVIRRSYLGWLSGRGFYWSLAFGWMVPSLLYLFVWATAANHGTVHGFSHDDFIVYYLCFLFLNQFTYPVANWTVGDFIRSGRFPTWLMRPLPPVFEAIASDIAMKVVCTPFTAVVTLILALVLHPASPFTWGSIFLFIPTLLLAQVLRFVMAYTLALLALWNSRSDALLTLNDGLIFLFAGQVAPTALLPGWLSASSNVLPYRYMLGFPIEVLMNRVHGVDFLQGISWLLFWNLIMLLVCGIIWRNGLRHYASVGS